MNSELSGQPVLLSNHPARRVHAMVMRYWFLLRGSAPRIAGLIYWPLIQVILWGLLSRFLQTNSSWVAQAAGVLIAAVILWDVLFRSQLGMSVCFMEEMWSRNLGQLFVTPLRPREWIAALMVTSIIRVAIGVLPAMVLAIPMYHYSIFSMGWGLLAFYIGLTLFGWAIAMIVMGLVLSLGLGAEEIAWMGMVILAPISAVYYPVTALPHWLQPVAWGLPSTYVFEGMRAVLFDHHFRTDLFAGAIGLDAVYFVLGSAAFLWAFRRARRRGALLQMGE